MASLTLYDPFGEMLFGKNHCFLCGTLTAPTDVIPVFSEWLMQQYNFQEKQLLLLDKSVISYRELTIPCCQNCRQNHVLPLEEKIKLAQENGITGFRALAERDIFFWITKMFYGILVRELLNEVNPLIKPEHAVGENPKMYLKFQSLFKLLQALRVPILYDDFTPFSLFIMEVLETPETEPFEYRDELNTMIFNIKMGEVWLVCHLLDNGMLQKALSPVWADIADKKVHPLQAAEFTARAYYAAYLLNIIPEYFERKANPTDDFLTYDTLVDDITTSIFNPWDNSAYAKLLAEMWKKWNISPEQIQRSIFEDPLSFIYDEEGNFQNPALVKVSS